VTSLTSQTLNRSSPCLKLEKENFPFDSAVDRLLLFIYRGYPYLDTSIGNTSYREWREARI